MFLKYNLQSMRATFELTLKSCTYLHKPSADYKLFVNKFAHITSKNKFVSSLAVTLFFYISCYFLINLDTFLIFLIFFNKYTTSNTSSHFLLCNNHELDTHRQHQNFEKHPRNLFRFCFRVVTFPSD